jgi:radical SAM superfamily enzyme YgiQ (UPF0313 family)
MSQKRNKLLLVNPINQHRLGFSIDPSTSYMPINLGIIAALTPGNWDIELVDESFEKCTFREADLVGFTAFTANAPRAYELAALFRQHGVHTVMGGIHASMMTEEAVNYFDTVVSGEAEVIWPQVIADFEAGNIKPLYLGGITPVERIPHVRREIFKKYPYVYDLIQISRGCPMGCDFCSVTKLCGSKYRERDVEDVLDELEETSRPMLFIVDDHLVNTNKGAEERAIRLFKGMVDRKLDKLWFGQAAMNFADNDEVLHWAAKSGCTLILLGVEAETPEALADAKKRLNLKRGVGYYDKAFKKIHKHGIAILGAMIFGMESDGIEDLHNRKKFVLTSGMDAMQTSIMTPLPGTDLFFRLRDQNRIDLNSYPEDWKHYHFKEATMGTSKMTREQLQDTMKEIWMTIYKKENIRKMMFKTLWRTRNFKAAYWVYGTNHNYGRIVLEDIINDKPDGMNRNLVLNSGKRSLYLKLTDYVLVIFYAVSWNKMVERFKGRIT